MKKRNGFVSNSSSASFVVNWKWKKEWKPEKNALIQALLDLFAPYHTLDKDTTLDDLKSDIDFNNLDSSDDNCKNRLEKIRLIVDKTTEDDEGYTTLFWTSMYNEHNDFGEIAMEMMFNLLLSNSLEYTYFTEKD